MTFEKLYLLSDVTNIGNYSHYFTKDRDFIVICEKDDNGIIIRIVAVNIRDTRYLKEFCPGDYSEVFSPNNEVPEYLFPWDYVY